MRLFLVVTILYLLAVQWAFADVFPRLFDDTKNTIFYAGAGLMAAVWLWRTRRDTIALTPLTLAGSAYFLAAALSIIGAPSGPYEGVLELARLILWIGAAFAFSRLSARDLRKIAGASLVSVALIAFLALSHKWGWMSFWTYANHPFLSPVGHTSYFGDLMALHFPVGLFLVWSSRRKWVWGILTGIILVGLAFSATRASALGAIAALVTGAVMAARLRWFSAGRTVLGLVLVLSAMAGLFSVRALSIRTNDTDVLGRLWHMGDGGVSHRVIAAGRTFDMVRERPLLGFGIGTYRFNYSKYAMQGDRPDLKRSASQWFMHPHNEFMHQWSGVGTLGLLAALSCVGLWFGRLWKGAKEALRPEQAILIMAAMGITVDLVSWQFSTTFLMPTSRLMTAFFIGAAWPHLRGRVLRTLPSWSRPVLMGLVLVATLVVGAYQLSIHFSDKSARTRVAADQAAAVRWSIGLAPWAFDPMFARAAFLMQEGDLSVAGPAVRSLHDAYPFVPYVLRLYGELAFRQRDWETSRQAFGFVHAFDPADEWSRVRLEKMGNTN